jgi:hypothetical protein
MTSPDFLSKPEQHRWLHSRWFALAEHLKVVHTESIAHNGRRATNQDADPWRFLLDLKLKIRADTHSRNAMIAMTSLRGAIVL